VFGLMALKLGAARVDFVDINPRAIDFTRGNCARNGFEESAYRAIPGSVSDFACAAPYDIVLANPPFVMTPPGIDGTLTSRAGPEGNDFAEMLLARLERLLAPEGEAYIYVLQFVRAETPLIAGALVRHLVERRVTMTPVQDEITPLDVYVAAYLERFPGRADAVRAWERELRARHGGSLGAQHYVMRIHARRPGPTSWSITRDLETEYGEGFAYPASSQHDLALGRVAENLVLGLDPEPS
jgi:hypothetical protein